MNIITHESAAAYVFDYFIALDDVVSCEIVDAYLSNDSDDDCTCIDVIACVTWAGGRVDHDINMTCWREPIMNNEIYGEW